MDEERLGDAWLRKAGMREKKDQGTAASTLFLAHTAIPRIYQICYCKIEKGYETTAIHRDYEGKKLTKKQEWNWH